MAWVQCINTKKKCIIFNHFATTQSNLYQTLFLHRVKQDHAGGIAKLKEAVDSENSIHVRSTCAVAACTHKLFRETIEFVEPLLAEHVDELKPSVLFSAALAYYNQKQDEKVLEITDKLLARNSPEVSSMELSTVHAIRAISLTSLNKCEEALQDIAKIEELPKVPMSDELGYSKIYDAKWTHLICLMKVKRTEVTEKAQEILFNSTDLSEPPADFQLSANRMMLFHQAVMLDKTRIVETVTRLTKEIIHNDKVHAYWKSCAILIKKQLSFFSKEQKAAESYKAIMLHRNVFTIVALGDLPSNVIATIPEMDRDKFLPALSEFEAILSNYKVDGLYKKYHSLWTNLASICFSLNDYARAAKYAEFGLHNYKEINPRDKGLLHRIAAMSHMLHKNFAKAVEFNFMESEGKQATIVGVDSLHAMVLATSFVMLGPEHEQEAKNLILRLHDGHYNSELAEMQLNVLRQHRPRILSEEVNFKVLADNWKALNTFTTATDSLETEKAALRVPELSKPLLSIIRYVTINRLGELYQAAGEDERAIEQFEIVQKEYPVLTSNHSMRVSYYRLGKGDELIETLNRLCGLTRDPVMLDSYTREIAVALYETGHYMEAYDTLLLVRDQTTKAFLESMVDVCKSLDLKAEALQYLDQILNHPEADVGMARIIRAGILLEQGKLEEAKKDYESVVDHPTKGITANLGLAKVYDGLNDNATALQQYAKVVNEFPHEAHEGSAVCLFRMGLHELALEQLELSFKHVDSKSSWALLLRANIYIGLNKVEEALEDYQAIISLASDHVVEALFDRGKLYCAIHKPAEAEEDFAAAIKLDPKIAEQIEIFHKSFDEAQSTIDVIN